MPLPAGSLVGREADLVVLERAFGRMRQGYGSAVAILGDAGIGKTRLILEARRLAGPGEVVLSGSASEFEGALPYGAFVGAFDDYLQTVDRGAFASLDADAHAALAALLPSYPAGHASAADAAVAHYQAQRATRALLSSLATVKPHVVVLDDLHWADAATIATVCALLRRPPDGSVLFVLASRVREAPTALLAALDDATQAGYADRLDLGPLTAGQCRLLLDPDVTDERAHELHEASGGNPFYLEQLVRIEGGTAGVALAHEGSRGELPPLVAAALTGELRTLAEAPKRLLQGAAVVGDPFEPELAARAGDLTDGEARDAIDVLLARDMIRHTDVPRRFRFRHPLLRRAVYETTPGGWRLGAHERCAAVLSEQGAASIVLALHLEHSARHGDNAAIAVLTDAGRRLMSRSPDDAARLLAAALRLVPAESADDIAHDLGMEIAAAYAAGAHLEAAHAMSIETLARLAPDDWARFAQLSSLCASVEHWLGRHDAAHRRLLDAVEHLPAQCPEAVSLFVQLTFDANYNGDLPSAEQWARQVVDHATAVDNDGGRATGYALLGLCSALDGNTDEARVSARSAAGLLDAMPDDHVVDALDALTTLAAAEHFLDLASRATSHVERALRVARGAGRDSAMALYWSGVIRATYQPLDQALEVLDAAVELARVSDQDLGIGWYLAARATVMSAMGDNAGALASARDAVEWLRPQHGPNSALVVRLGAATVLCDVGQPESALQELRACASTGGAPIAPRWRLQVAEQTARAALALGHVDDADQAAKDALEIAARLDVCSVNGIAQRSALAVAFARGQYDEAVEHGLLAAADFDTAGARLQAARTKLLVGKVFAAAGDAPAAIEHLTRAAEESGSLNAHGLRAEAERELRKLGRRPSRRSGASVADGSALATLTAREREVSTLVAQGKTNPQIATELFLSTKTVESHVRNVFHKLHVTTRVELAQLVDRAQR